MKSCTEYRLCTDGDGLFGFIVTATEVTTTCVDLSVAEVVSDIMSGSDNALETEPYLRCAIKWDSCAHFTFGEVDGNGYLHICGVRQFQKHCRLIKELYLLAFKLMGRDPEPNENWTEA